MVLVRQLFCTSACCAALKNAARSARRAPINGDAKSRARHCKTLASTHVQHCNRIAPHLDSFQALRVRRQLIAVAAHASRYGQRCDAARRHQFDALGSQRCSFRCTRMPEKYDDEDEVGTGLYVLIGCAAVTVVLMYSWIGYTLYQGFKARRKVD